ncbi:uncharacterized protein LOC120656265 [Panicum virgatum]|uniref:uncharacterized protein LOC120656265 n=1 Tax=Panicum virgatum TaxID=38727 RepID=UPI0019D66322|nr:uncharacterized protein LOC120656265 [Panicum virgatum]
MEDELDIISFFCRVCGILLRTTDEIIEHRKSSGHHGVSGSMDNKQKLYCQECQKVFSLRTKVYGHKHETGGSHSKFQLRNHQQDETTPPVLMPKIRSWVQSEADEEPPFDYSEDEDDDEDDPNDPDYDPREDSNYDPREDPDCDPAQDFADIPDPVEVSSDDGAKFKPTTLSALLDLPHPSDDESLNQDDDSSFAGLVTRRTLKHLGYKAHESITMRKAHGGQTGTLIPSETDLVTHIDIGKNVRYVLVLEKEIAFYELTGTKFPELENCILLSGKGHSDIVTRILLRKIRISSPTLPMYCVGISRWP